MEVTIEKLKGLLAKTSKGDFAFELDEKESLKEQGVDSLDMMDFYLSIEEEFGVQIPDEDINELETFENFREYLSKK